MVRQGPMIDGVVAPSAIKPGSGNTYGVETPGTEQDQSLFKKVLAAQESGSGIAGMTDAATTVQSGYANPALQPTTAPTTSPFGGGAGGLSRYTDAEIDYILNGGGGGVTQPWGTTTTPPPPPGGGGGSDTVAPPAGEGGNPNPGDLSQISINAIEGQINALEAQYGLDLASIAALGGEIGQQAKFLLAQLGIDQERAQEGLVGNLVSRGVLRSGITARDFGRQSQDFAMQRAEIEMNKGSRLRQLAERAGAASAAMGRGKADVIANIDQGNLPAEIRSRLLGELQGLTPADIQRALDAAYSGNQQSLTSILDQTGQGGLNFQGSQVDNAIGSYTGEVVGGWRIDPATGTAVEYVGDQAQPNPQPAGQIPRTGNQTIDPEELNKLLEAGQLSTFQNALRTAPTGY